MEENGHSDDDESDQDDPEDGRDPQSNEEGREQGEQGEQDGGVDGDANDNSASVKHSSDHYGRKRDYNEKAYELAAAVNGSENWTDERKDWFKNEFLKPVYPANHWKKLAKFYGSRCCALLMTGLRGWRGQK